MDTTICGVGVEIFQVPPIFQQGLKLWGFGKQKVIWKTFVACNENSAESITYHGCSQDLFTSIRDQYVAIGNRVRFRYQIAGLQFCFGW